MEQTVDLKQVQHVKDKVNRRIGSKSEELQLDELEIAEKLQNNVGVDETVEDYTQELVDQRIQIIQRKVKDNQGDTPPREKVREMIDQGLADEQIVTRFSNMKRVQIAVGKEENRHVPLEEALRNLEQTGQTINDAISNILDEERE